MIKIINYFIFMFNVYLTVINQDSLKTIIFVLYLQNNNFYYTIFITQMIKFWTDRSLTKKNNNKQIRNPNLNIYSLEWVYLVYVARPGIDQLCYSRVFTSAEFYAVSFKTHNSFWQNTVLSVGYTNIQNVISMHWNMSKRIKMQNPKEMCKLLIFTSTFTDISISWIWQP